MVELQKLGFELILVVGPPGTGKSTGMRTLPTKTNIWFNVDKKNPVWEGGKTEYGRKDSPKGPFHMIPEVYSEMITHIKLGLEKGMFEDEKYAIITGHTENFKEGAETRVRLKTLGNMNNKMQLEGKLETVFYSAVELENGEPKYILETQNNGYNTARSPMGLFEGKIPNDYGFIIDKLLTY